MKFTCCNVVPDELAAYTEFNPERKIDLGISAIGAFKRMTADIEKVGILNKVLIEEKRKMKAMFGLRVKDELKRIK